MTQRTAPKLVGLDCELAHCALGDVDEAAQLRCGGALVHAHHKLFGPRPDIPGSHINEFDAHGFRVYLDHHHAEICLPLVASATDVVLALRRSRQYLREFNRLAEAETGPMHVAFDCTNRRGVSWGAHVNVLVSREAFDDWRNAEWLPLMRHWVPCTATSPALFGAGKLGAENGGAPCAFQLSHRADFIDRIVGLETVASKSIINTRDEPLMDPARFARFHIIPFDANRLEFANWLKFGVIQLLLALVEEQYPAPNLTLEDPLATFATCSRAVTCKCPVKLANGKTMTALEIQYRLAEAVYDAIHAGAAAAAVPDARLILSHWLHTLHALARHDEALIRRLDWRARLAFIDAADKGNPDTPHAREAADLRFGELDGIVDHLESTGAVDTLEQFLKLKETPAFEMVPRDVLRGLLIGRFGRRLVESDWHRLVFEPAEGIFWRVELAQPDFEASLLTCAKEAPNLAECLAHPTFAAIAAPVAFEAVLALSDEVRLNIGGSCDGKRT